MDTDRLLRGSRALGRRRATAPPPDHRRTALGPGRRCSASAGPSVRADLDGLAGRLPWTGRARRRDATLPVPPRVDGVPGAAARPGPGRHRPGRAALRVRPGRARYLAWSVHAADVGDRPGSTSGRHTVTVELAASVDVAAHDAEGLPVDLVPELVKDGVYDGTVRTPRGPMAHRSGCRALAARAGPVRPCQCHRPRTRQALCDVVGALRLDQACRCAGPLRLTTLPAGAPDHQLRGGRSRSFPAALACTSIFSRGAAGRAIHVELQLPLRRASPAARTEETGQSPARPAYLAPDGTSLELLGLPEGATWSRSCGGRLAGTAGVHRGGCDDGAGGAQVAERPGPAARRWK